MYRNWDKIQNLGEHQDLRKTPRLFEKKWWSPSVQQQYGFPSCAGCGKSLSKEWEYTATTSLCDKCHKEAQVQHAPDPCPDIGYKIHHVSNGYYAVDSHRVYFTTSRVWERATSDNLTTCYWLNEAELKAAIKETQCSPTTSVHTATTSSPTTPKTSPSTGAAAHVSASGTSTVSTAPAYGSSSPQTSEGPESAGWKAGSSDMYYKGKFAMWLGGYRGGKNRKWFGAEQGKVTPKELCNKNDWREIDALLFPKAYVPDTSDGTELEPPESDGWQITSRRARGGVNYKRNNGFAHNHVCYDGVGWTAGGAGTGSSYASWLVLKKALIKAGLYD